jgi:hypothetical protein
MIYLLFCDSPGLGGVWVGLRSGKRHIFMEKDIDMFVIILLLLWELFFLLSGL